jgi:hypothetical protein
MRGRQKFCDLSVYLPCGLFEVLAQGAERHGTPWHLAYQEIECRLQGRVLAEAERLIREYAAEGDENAARTGVG